MVTYQKHVYPILQLFRNRKNEFILQCHIHTLPSTWQCILMIYYKSLCKKVVTLTLFIFLITYNEKKIKMKCF